MKKLLITATLLLLLSLKPLFAGVAKGVDVREVQIILTELCFNPGPIDGVWGKKTEKAAEEFFTKYFKIYGGYFGHDQLKMLQLSGRSHVLSGKEVKRCSVSISDKLAQRKTINLFKPWHLNEGTKGYGLYWGGNSVKPSVEAITLLTPQWNMYNSNHGIYTPGVEQFYLKRTWNHDAEYGNSIPLDYANPNFNAWYINLVDGRVRKRSADGIMLDWWHDGHYHSNGFPRTKSESTDIYFSKSAKTFWRDFIIMGNVNYGDDTDVKNLNGVLWSYGKATLSVSIQITKS